MPPKRKKAAPPPADTPRQFTPAPRSMRWRWVRHKDGARVAERIEPRPGRERTQAEADLYGNFPYLSTGSHLRTAASALTELLATLHIEETDIGPELLAQAWHQAVGDFLATRAELASLDKGVAYIRTAHPAVRFELERHRRDIIRVLNDTLGEGCVQRVRITHG